MKRRLVLVMAALALAACDSEPELPTGPSVTGPFMFTAQLASSNEVPPIGNAEAGARGGVSISMDVPRDATGAVIGPGTVTFALQLANFPPNSAAILAHIHIGPAGVNGPIVVNTGLTATAPIVIGDGTATITIGNAPVSLDIARQIVANPAGFYFNAHSPLNPGGVVRGQLVPQQ